MQSPLRIEALGPGDEPAFLALHDERLVAGWCRCVAWHVPAWDGWGDRTAEENLALRCALHRRGEHDGLLAWDGADVVGWVQVGPRDRLPKLLAQLELDPDPGVWAVTCFLVAPDRRRRGIATALLAAAVEHARAAGATRVEGYPRAVDGEDDADAWTGTAALFARAGFERVRAGSPRAVVALGFDATEARPTPG